MIIFLLILAFLANAQPPSTDSRNSQIPNTDTHFRMPAYASLEQWEARKQQLRAQILFAAGLDPLPDRNPLKPVVSAVANQPEYTIQKVLLETLPGYYLGGNLYKPAKASGKLPAIATPHGHWTYGRLEHQPLGSVPARCINLARQGYIVFAYDMVGYNDTIQTPHSFAGPRERLWAFGPLGLQLWNSIRVVDFLASLPETDPSRIGATGASGGGTQTFLLAAVDERVQFSAPVNMVSAIMQGGSPCENQAGLRIDAFNVEFAAMMAPRPMLLVAATGDWTRNTMKEEYPAIRRIYELHGKQDLVEAVQFDAPHNYHQESREAVYQFFARRMLGAEDAASFREKSVRLERLNDMLALHNRRLPEGALSYDALFAQWRDNAARQVASIRDKAGLRRLLQAAIGASMPEKVDQIPQGETIILTRSGIGDRIPALWREGKGKPALIVHEQGAAAAAASAEAAALRQQGRPILAIDAFQTGSAKAERNRSHAHFLTFNRPDDALRVQDILTAAAWLRARTGQAPELIGLEAGAVWCRFAAALLPTPVELRAETAFQGTEQELLRLFNVPGIQRAGGWQTALALTR